jgi:trk system potassium uptake protein TrkA
MLAGIIRQDAITIPSGESTVNPGDRIIIFARRDSIPKIEKMLSVKLEFF